MAKYHRQLRVTKVRVDIGLRGGIHNATRHYFVQRRNNMNPITMVRNNASGYVVPGFKGFLALLHYAGLCPASTLNIRKLTVEGAEPRQGQQIKNYLSNNRVRPHGLGGIKILHVKISGTQRVQTYRFKIKAHKFTTPWNLNDIELGEHNRDLINQGVGNSLSLSKANLERDYRLVVGSVREFMELVYNSSQNVTYTNSLKILIMENVDDVDWTDVVAFFTEVRAGYKNFKQLKHLINTLK
ncbi:hypothetical protein DFH28DRAFT_921369 [Melampsora americana]|nr:hypothetical protein DFH28DRAFT_921369 [Melampsora americana]